MMTGQSLGLVVVGLVFLTGGGELLIRGSTRLASLLGISPLIIGLTIVAFGTSAPELAVSLQAAFAGNASIAVGNVAGSNQFNLLFILGLCAIISPLLVQSQLIKVDVPIMVVCSALVTALAWDGRITRSEGVVLALLAVAYTALQVILSRRDKKSVQEEFAAEYGSPPSEKTAPWLGTLRSLAFVAAGGVCLVFGADWLVQGAVSLAHFFGVSDAMIGLTLVAAGTSLPEVVTSVLATLKGERDIAVGNVVGSNIYNLLLILGASSALSPEGIKVIPSLAHFDLPLMAVAAAVSLPVFVSGKRISRWEGALFFTAYVGYTVYLVLNAY